MENVIVFFPLETTSNRNTSYNFQSYNPGILLQFKTPVDFLFLKSEAEEGAIKTHHGPYDYRNIEQKVVEAETCERV